MSPEVGRPDRGMGQDGFSNSFGLESTNAGNFPILPVEKKLGRLDVKPIDNAKRTPPEGVNLIKQQMDAALAKLKAEDPQYNQPHEVGPVEVKQVDRTVVEKIDRAPQIEMSESEAGQREKKPRRENEIHFDELAETLIVESSGRSGTLGELLQKIPVVDIGKNLNIRQLTRELSRDLQTLRGFEKNPSMSEEMRKKMGQRAEAIEASLDTVNIINKNFGAKKESPPSRTAPVQILRQTPTQPSPMRTPQPTGALKQNFWSKLKFW